MNDHCRIREKFDEQGLPDVEVLEIRLLSGERPLKALVDVRIGDWIIHDFRVVKQNGQKASVLSPQVSWKDPESGVIKFKGIFTLPPEQKQRIEMAVLSAFQRKMESENGRKGSPG